MQFINIVTINILLALNNIGDVRCRGTQNTLRRNSKSRLEPMLFPLEYPGKNKDALDIISDKWDKYYKCLNEQILTYGCDRMIPLIATMAFVGTTLTLKCGLCQSPMDGNLIPDWYYSDCYTSDNADVLPDQETKVISPEDGTLHIFNIQQEDSGLYFCQSKNLLGPNYYVHIADTTEPITTVWPNKAPNGKHELQEMNLEDLGIILKTEWSDWTNCNRCDRTGRRMRYGTCIVVTTVNKKCEAKVKGVLILYYFKYGIPCRSPLLPDSIFQRKEVQQRPSQIMNSYCKVPCKEKCTKYGKLNKTNSPLRDHGDILSFKELLPPTKPLPARTTFYAQYNEETTISCPGSLNVDTPVLWKVGNKPIYGPIIKNQTNGRININDLNQIVFKKVKYSDTQMYSCWQRSGMAGTIHLIVFQSTNRKIDKAVTNISCLVILTIFLILIYNMLKARLFKTGCNQRQHYNQISSNERMKYRFFRIKL